MSRDLSIRSIHNMVEQNKNILQIEDFNRYGATKSVSNEKDLKHKEEFIIECPYSFCRAQTFPSPYRNMVELNFFQKNPITLVKPFWNTRPPILHKQVGDSSNFLKLIYMVNQAFNEEFTNKPFLYELSNYFEKLKDYSLNLDTFYFNNENGPNTFGTLDTFVKIWKSESFSLRYKIALNDSVYNPRAKSLSKTAIDETEIDRLSGKGLGKIFLLNIDSKSILDSRKFVPKSIEKKFDLSQPTLTDLSHSKKPSV